MPLIVTGICVSLSGIPKIPSAERGGSSSQSQGGIDRGDKGLSQTQHLRTTVSSLPLLPNFCWAQLGSRSPPGGQDLALGDTFGVVGAAPIPCRSSPPASEGSVGLGHGTSSLAKPIACSG